MLELSRSRSRGKEEESHNQKYLLGLILGVSSVAMWPDLLWISRGMTTVVAREHQRAIAEAREQDRLDPVASAAAEWEALRPFLNLIACTAMQ